LKKKKKSVKAGRGTSKRESRRRGKKKRLLSKKKSRTRKSLGRKGLRKKKGKKLPLGQVNRCKRDLPPPEGTDPRKEKGGRVKNRGGYFLVFV